MRHPRRKDTKKNRISPYFFYGLFIKVRCHEIQCRCMIASPASTETLVLHALSAQSLSACFRNFSPSRRLRAAQKPTISERDLCVFVYQIFSALGRPTPFGRLTSFQPGPFQGPANRKRLRCQSPVLLQTLLI